MKRATSYMKMLVYLQTYTFVTTIDGNVRIFGEHFAKHTSVLTLDIITKYRKYFQKASIFLQPVWIVLHNYFHPTKLFSVQFIAKLLDIYFGKNYSFHVYMYITKGSTDRISWITMFFTYILFRFRFFMFYALFSICSQSITFRYIFNR